MANIAKIKLGDTTYDIKDESARSDIDAITDYDTNNNIYVKTSQLEVNGDTTTDGTIISKSSQTIQTSLIDRDGDIPSNTVWGPVHGFKDKHDENIGYLQIYQANGTAGSIGLSLQTYNEDTDGNQVGNYLRLSVGKNGTCYYSVSDPTAFRTAIDAAATSHTHSTSDISGYIDRAHGGTGSDNTQRAVNTVFAGPSSGTSAGNASWRKLVAADIPDLSNTYLPLTGEKTILGNVYYKDANIYIKDSDFNRDGTNPSSKLWSNQLVFQDKDAETLGYIQAYQTTTGATGLRIYTVAEKNSDTTYSNYIDLDVDKNGNRTYTIAAPQAFRDAISAAAASHTHPASDITGTLGVTHGGTGVIANPSMLVNLASTTADTVFEETPRPGITGTLPVSHGGTGATTVAAARNALNVVMCSNQEDMQSNVGSLTAAGQHWALKATTTNSEDRYAGSVNGILVSDTNLKIYHWKDSSKTTDTSGTFSAMLGGKILYTSSAGSTGTITTTATIAPEPFTHMWIIYKGNDGFQHSSLVKLTVSGSGRTGTSSGTAALSVIENTSSVTTHNTNIKWRTVTISEQPRTSSDTKDPANRVYQISTSNYGEWDNGVAGTNNHIYILQVIGLYLN